MRLDVHGDVSPKYVEIRREQLKKCFGTDTFRTARHACTRLLPSREACGRHGRSCLARFGRARGFPGAPDRLQP